MKIKIKSKSNPNKDYEIDTLALTCSCPDFVNRRRYRGEWCKHLKEEIPKLGDKIKEMLLFIEKDSNVFHFIKEYGEDCLEYLVLKGDVIETKTKLKILK